jgi:hypothetical protein
VAMRTSSSRRVTRRVGGSFAAAALSFGGGTGGAGGSPGEDGTEGQGGAGAPGDEEAGGGGGGGLFGGGGGAGDFDQPVAPAGGAGKSVAPQNGLVTDSEAGGGGGGGSGSGPAGVAFETGVREGDGVVTITYDADAGGCPQPAQPAAVTVVAQPRFTG